MRMMKIDPSEWLNMLQSQGYRLTPAKTALIHALSCAAFPLSAETAWELVRQQRPTTGRATVYRLFETLEAHGLLRRVHGVNHCNQYVLAQDSALPLIVCLVCGKAEFLAADDLRTQIEALSHRSGYRVQAAHIQLLGTCTFCQSNA